MVQVLGLFSWNTYITVFLEDLLVARLVSRTTNSGVPEVILPGCQTEVSNSKPGLEIISFRSYIHIKSLIIENRTLNCRSLLSGISVVTIIENVSESNILMIVQTFECWSFGIPWYRFLTLKCQSFRISWQYLEKNILSDLVNPVRVHRGTRGLWQNSNIRDSYI